jgi:hypothetical protein
VITRSQGGRQLVDEPSGRESDRGAAIRLAPHVSDKGTNREAGATTPSPPDAEIDLTDRPPVGIAPADSPVLDLLREQLGRLRSENRELRELAVVGRSPAASLAVSLARERRRASALDAEVKKLDGRAASLALSLARERRRASALDAEVKKLHKRIRRLEAELAEPRPRVRKHKGSDDQVGIVRRALPSRTRPHSEEIDPSTAARIETIGKMAHLHKDLMEKNNGHLTLGESLELRRSYYGDRVRASGGLFGKRDSKAILYRDVPEGKRREPGDPVRLTQEGERLATAYRRGLQRQ